MEGGNQRDHQERPAERARASLPMAHVATAAGVAPETSDPGNAKGVGEYELARHGGSQVQVLSNSHQCRWSAWAATRMRTPATKMSMRAHFIARIRAAPVPPHAGCFAQA